MKLHVTWEMCGEIDVPASTAEEAIKYFEKNVDYINLPENREYVDGSFGLSCTDIEYIEAIQ